MEKCRRVSRRGKCSAALRAGFKRGDEKREEKKSFWSVLRVIYRPFTNISSMSAA